MLVIRTALSGLATRPHQRPYKATGKGIGGAARPSCQSTCHLLPLLSSRSLYTIYSLNYQMIDPGRIQLLFRFSKTYAATKQPQAQSGSEHLKAHNQTIMNRPHQSGNSSMCGEVVKKVINGVESGIIGSGCVLFIF